VLKRALRVVVTFGVLVAGCAGYGQGFSLLTRWVGVKSEVPVLERNLSPARTAQIGIRLATQAFGEGHWTTRPDERMCVYDIGRGTWFFFKSYERLAEGRRLKFTPFALIWKSKTKDNLNTILGNEAILDFDKPYDLQPSGGGEPAQVVYAKVSGEVRMRDDKGTGDTPGDDLTIGPMQDLEYRQAQRSLYTESRVVMREKDLTAEATGMTIVLRQSPPPAGKPEAKSNGYSGAESINLHKKVQINVADVGRTGLVPGGKASTEKRPGNLTADGPARIDLPEPRPKGAPPGDPKPIVATFTLNVCLRQGEPQRPDQINADELVLTLYPVEAKPETAEAAVAEADPEAKPTETEADPDEAADGRLSKMELRLAQATGHAVWVQSPSQGLKARGNELRYERHAPEAPDSIYFRGDKSTWVEKETLVSEGERAGQVQSIDALSATDITILQPLKPGEQATLIARGPGRMQTSPGKGLPAERTATWNDRLEVRTVETKVGPRRQIELTGSPRLHSPTQGRIDAEQSIVAYLIEQPKAEAGTEAATATASAPLGDARGAFRIDWMDAEGQVLMEAAAQPAKPGEAPGPARTLRARKHLSVTFDGESKAETAAVDPVAATAPATPAEPKVTRILPAAAASARDEPGAPRLEATAVAEARAAEEKAAQAQVQAEVAAKPSADASPARQSAPMEAEADVVWARMRLGSPTSKPDLEEVQLQSNVTLHQDPEPGHERGTDASGNLVIFLNRGPGRAKVEARGTLDRFAKIVSSGLSIEGARMDVDQASDVAHVYGPGVLSQTPEVKAGAPEAEVVPTAFVTDDTGQTPAMATKLKGPVTIAWQKGMTFYGQPRDVSGRALPAYALFEGDVRAWTFDPEKHSESVLHYGRMRAVLDASVSFARAVPTIGRSASEAEEEKEQEKRPAPKIVALHCQDMAGAGQLVHRLRDEATGLLAQQAKLDANDVWYNVVTGYFVAEGKGQLRLYKRDGTKLGGGGLAVGPAGENAPSDLPAPARPAATPARGGMPAMPSPTAPAVQPVAPVAGRDSRIRPTAFVVGQAPALSAVAAKTMELTKVTYLKRVEGRFMPDSENSPDTPFQAKFIGGVQVMQAKVVDERQDVSLDDLPAEFLFLAGDQVEVIRETGAAAGTSESAEAFFIDVTGRQPMARDAQKSIKGDRITYDSAKQLVYIYGEENGVTITSQDGLGQPFSAARVRAVMYNRLSGDIRMIEPQGMLLIDPRSGVRSTPTGPGQPREVKPPKVKPPLRRVPGSDKERKGYTGR
jgi:lipopolysaccharide export system protein LptA